MHKNTQIVIGVGNKTSMVDKESKVLPLTELLSKLSGLFEKKDSEINKLLPHGIQIVKTNENKVFRSEKILSSLLKIGMPLEIAVQTLDTVISKAKVIATEKGSLTTKEIRQWAAEAIRNINIDDRLEAEEWSYRFTRKYGHDNRRIIIYNCPPDSTEEYVSYYIIYKMMDDAFNRIIPLSAVQAIPRQQKDKMAGYILEFINGCDLYYIDYDILLSMIVEMSRQPPHPWLITEKTRQKLYDYDIAAIKSNVEQLKLSNRQENDNILYCYSEIIHHASSLILEKYEWFLGQDEFRSFYILKGLIERYRSTDFPQIASGNSSIQKLERDLVLAGESIESLFEIMRNVRDFLKAQEINQSNDELFIKYGSIAINLMETCSVESITQAIYEDWSDKDGQLIIKIIFNVLRTLSHASTINTPDFENNMFRFPFNEISFDGYELKKQYIVVYVSKDYDYTILERLQGRIYTDCANVILVMSEDDNETENITRKIGERTNSNYWCVPVKKNDLIAFLTYDNPANYFFQIVRCAIRKK